MKKAVLFILALVALPMCAQEKDKHFLSNLNIAVRASTLGFGAEVATPIHSNFTLRAGFSFLGKSSIYKEGFDIKSLNDEKINYAMTDFYGYVPYAYLTAGAKMANVNVLVDILPVKNSIFHITVGFYAGDIALAMGKGYLSSDSEGKNKSLPIPGKKGGVTFELAGKEVKLDERSTLSAKLKYGTSTIKPYVGIGIGRSVTNSRLGAKFELGTLYTGGFLATLNDSKLPVKDLVKELGKADPDIEKSFNRIEPIANWFPLINFQLTYRLY